MVGFLRGCGMFYGLSNPLMGVFSLIAALVHSPFNFLYLIWTVGWSMLWAFAIDAPRELIYNGLYPSQGILLGELSEPSNLGDSSNFTYFSLKRTYKYICVSQRHKLISILAYYSKWSVHIGNAAAQL